jgi:hypothetical protein
MGKVIVCNIMSVDGFYEGPGGNVMALNMDESFDAYNLERIRAAGTVLLGRRSFEGFSAYWPGVADAPADPANRALSDDNRALSRIYNRLPKVVVSDSYAPPADNPWHDTTTVLRRDEVASWLAKERVTDASEILIFASRTIRSVAAGCAPLRRFGQRAPPIRRRQRAATIRAA